MLAYIVRRLLQRLLVEWEGAVEPPPYPHDRIAPAAPALEAW